MYGTYQLPRAGFEPTTPGLGNRKDISTSGEGSTSCETPVDCVAVCVALLEQESPDLAAVVKDWKALPKAVKAGILAMIGAATKG